MPDATTTTADTKTTTVAANTATVEPFYKDWLQSDGSLNAKSYDRLPEHLKGLRPTLERQNNIEGVLLALDHAQTLSGRKALAPLPVTATPEQIAERKSILDTINGVPKEAKEYGITRPDDLPESQWNQKLADGYATWAHKNSITPTAAKELLALQIGTVKEQLQAQAQGEGAFWAKEQKTFESVVAGQNRPLDQANALVEKGAVAFNLKLDDPQTQIFLKGAQARLMCMQHAIAMGEDTTITGADKGGGGGDIDARIKEARADPAYKNEGNKYSRTDHDAAVARVNELYRLQSSGKGRR